MSELDPIDAKMIEEMIATIPQSRASMDAVRTAMVAFEDVGHQLLGEMAVLLALFAEGALGKLKKASASEEVATRMVATRFILAADLMLRRLHRSEGGELSPARVGLHAYSVTKAVIESGGLDYLEDLLSERATETETEDEDVVIVQLKLLRQAHAVMRECGWKNAMDGEMQADGVLQAAAVEIEGKFADLLASVEKEAADG